MWCLVLIQFLGNWVAKAGCCGSGPSAVLDQHKTTMSLPISVNGNTVSFVFESGRTYEIEDNQAQFLLSLYVVVNNNKFFYFKEAS